MIDVKPNASVIIVDNDPAARNSVRTLMKFLRFANIREVESCDDAFRLHERSPADLIIIEPKISEKEGVRLIRKIRHHLHGAAQRAPIILLSEIISEGELKAARDAGVSACVLKPLSARNLCSKVDFVATSDRAFVETRNYVGPDRRVGLTPDYNGPDRRGTVFLDDELEAGVLSEASRECLDSVLV